MRRFLVLAFLLVVVLCSTALGAENNWRINIKGDSGSGVGAGYPLTIGVGTAEHFRATNVDVTLSTVYVLCESADHRAYTRCIKSPTEVPKWRIRVAGAPNYMGNSIRLSFYTVLHTVLPPTSISGSPVSWRLKMVDNKGVPGAPANGTTWVMPIPTAHSVIPYWTLPAFPTIKFSTASDASILAEAYAFEFSAIVPEPSCVLALGSGILGLAGYVLRRRRD